MSILRKGVVRSISILFGILSVLIFATSVDAGSNASAANASMIALIANPSTFDGKLVRTTGVLCITTQDEGDALYLHEEDLRYAIDVNSLSLHLNDEEKNLFHSANLRHVLLEGTFHANARGASQPGFISIIGRLEIWDSDMQSQGPSTAMACPVAINLPNA